MKLDFSELLQQPQRQTEPAGNAITKDRTQAIIKALESGGDIYAIALMLCDALADNLHNELFRQRAHDALFLLHHDVLQQGSDDFSQKRYEEAYKKYSLLSNSTREHQKLDKLIAAAQGAHRATQH